MATKYLGVAFIKDEVVIRSNGMARLHDGKILGLSSLFKDIKDSGVWCEHWKNDYDGKFIIKRVAFDVIKSWIERSEPDCNDMILNGYASMPLNEYLRKVLGDAT